MAVNTVNEYIENLNEDGKLVVNDFIQYMKQHYPDLNHKISFSMPMWFMGKKMNEGYIGISAAKNHFSIHFSNEEFVTNLANELPTCKNGKRCINIKYTDKEAYSKVKESIAHFLEISK